MALCCGCNLAQDNRMNLYDVKLLLEDEQSGNKVMSWHGRALWDRIKYSIESDGDAVRASAFLGITRH